MKPVLTDEEIEQRVRSTTHYVTTVAGITDADATALCRSIERLACEKMMELVCGSCGCSIEAECECSDQQEITRAEYLHREEEG